MSEPVPQAFPIQVLSLGSLLAALVLAVITTPAEEAGLLGRGTGTWTYGWHALALAAGVTGLITERRWSVPLVVVGASGAILTAQPPAFAARDLLTWLVYGLLVMAHLEFRDGARRVVAWARGAGARLDVGHVVRSYLRRATIAFLATAGLALAALTFPTWAAGFLPAPVAHGIELQGTYGLVLGLVCGLGATFVVAWVLQAAFGRASVAPVAQEVTT